MDTTKTEQKRKLIAMTMQKPSGQQVTVFMKGDVGPDGKTRLDRRTLNQVVRAVGADKIIG